MPSVRIGTRGSALARWQANHVKERLERALGIEIQLSIIATAGDMSSRPLPEIGSAAGGKGLFVKEIEEALLDGRVSIAVHSAKDLPSVETDGLRLAAFLEREDPRDAFLTRDGSGLAGLPRGARVGTSSLRRMAQVRSRRPDVALIDLRGNVDTRVRKLDEGRYDGIVLALAGLKRMGLAGRASEILDLEPMLPAVGPGAMAVETRADDPLARRIAAAMDHPPTRAAVEAERGFLATLNGGCQLPVAAHARVDGAVLRLDALIAAPWNGAGAPVSAAEARDSAAAIVRGSRSGPVDAPTALGRSLAEELLARGGAEILAAVHAGRPA